MNRAVDGLLSGSVTVPQVALVPGRQGMRIQVDHVLPIIASGPATDDRPIIIVRWPIHKSDFAHRLTKNVRQDVQRFPKRVELVAAGIFEPRATGGDSAVKSPTDLVGMSGFQNRDVSAVTRWPCGLCVANCRQHQEGYKFDQGVARFHRRLRRQPEPVVSC